MSTKTQTEQREAGRVMTAPSPIRTTYWAKPIPLRQFDWEATEDSYEPGCPIGYGRTESEAIADLQEQLEERS